MIITMMDASPPVHVKYKDDSRVGCPHPQATKQTEVVWDWAEDSDLNH